MAMSRGFSPRRGGPDFTKKQAGHSEKLEIVIVGDADAGKGKFLAALLGKKKLDPVVPLVKFVTVDALRYQLNFTVCIGNERSYLLFDEPSREANGFIFLYDVSLRHTFAAFERWRETIAPSGEDDIPPVIMLGFAPNERSRERRCISSHEAKVIADSYGFQHRDIDFDSEMAPLLQKLVADIRRDEYEAVDDAASIPLVDMIVLGDVFVGKTSLVNRLMTGEFENKYVSTMPTRPRKVKVVVDDSLAILRLRDTPGTMYTNIVTPEFMNTIHSAIIVYDTTSRPTFETAQQIRRLVLAAKQDRRISVILVGNKNDDQFLCPRQVSFAEGAALARSWKCPFLEISCKTGNVDHVFKEAIREYRLTFNYDIVSSPKLDWSGFVQLNISGAKFQKKWLSVRAGKVSYGTKADSIKSLKQIDMSPDVGVIEGNHDKGSLLILSVIGITPHIQCLLPTHAERAALADALFSELAFLRVMDEILTDVTKLAIQSVYEPPPKDSSLCILAHGRLPSGSTSDATGSTPSSSTTSNTSSATQNHGSNGTGLLPTQTSPYGNLPSTPTTSGSTPFRRIKN